MTGIMKKQRLLVFKMTYKKNLKIMIKKMMIWKKRMETIMMNNLRKNNKKKNLKIILI